MESGLFKLGASKGIGGELDEIKEWELMIIDNGMKLPSYD